MKRRILVMLLLAGLIISLLQLPAYAEKQPYGSIPILIGYSDVDYMADQILAEIPVEGKTAKAKIQAVYDWIITHCKRDNWDGTYYFDEEQVISNAYAYNEKSSEWISSSKAIVRPQWFEDFELMTYDCTYDSNLYIASFAYDMMMQRTGNCAHYSALLAVLLGHLGFDCRLIPGDFINGDGSSVMHKWNYVLVDGKYYWLDVRIDHSTYTSTGSVAHNFFMVEDTASWAKRHTWTHTYSDLLSENTTKITELYETYKHEHILEKVADTAPSCEKDGCYAHYACTICGACYQDEQGQLPIQYSQIAITALGHDWDNWSTKKEVSHTEYGILERICKNDPSHIETQWIKALGNQFEDVPAGEYYETPVVWAVDNTITYGTSTQNFSPSVSCTRAQVVTFLWRAAGCPEPTQQASVFTDVTDKNSYYYSAVLWAVEKKITSGTSATKFSPNAGCTRGQVATFLWRAADNPTPSSSINPFTDVKQDAYYNTAVLWAVEKGITNGVSENRFSANSTCTRGQIVTFLYRSMGKEE